MRVESHVYQLLTLTLIFILIFQYRKIGSKLTQQTQQVSNINGINGFRCAISCRLSGTTGTHTSLLAQKNGLCEKKSPNQS